MALLQLSVMSLKYIKIKAGEQGLKNILERLPEEDKIVLNMKILPTEWYPFRTYVNILTLIDRQFGNGDLSVCREVGEWSAERDLKAVYNIYSKEIFKDPSILRTAPSIMWKGYYDKGDLVFPEIPNTLDVTEATAKVIDFPDAAKPNCTLLEGWIGKVMEIIIGGGHKARVREVKCRANGADYCEFYGVRVKRGDDSAYISHRRF